MRIWHQRLIPNLCRRHLLAAWREGLGCYSILANNKKGYRKHPAVIEFEDNHGELYRRLMMIRSEMVKRGYNPKPLPPYKQSPLGAIKPWQSYEEQVEVLRGKRKDGCTCLLDM